MVGFVTGKIMNGNVKMELSVFYTKHRVGNNNYFLPPNLPKYKSLTTKEDFFAPASKVE